MNTILYQAKESTRFELGEADQGGDLRVGQARESLLGSTSRRKHRKPLQLLSNVLLALSLTGLIVYYFPVIQSEGFYKVRTLIAKWEGKSEILDGEVGSEIKEIVGVNENKKSLADILNTSWQTDALAAINAPDSEFSIVIPKISASARVIANVDAGNAKKYNEALRDGIAHAAGTVFPGMKGTTYLFAHSTDGPWNVRRYNAIFYLLKEMTAGDEVVVFFEGKKFFYTVTSKEIRDPKNTELFSQKDEELLVLQTCWPPGTVKQVLLVTAKRKTT